MKMHAKSEDGAAFVEAAILFPIMIMIFAALVLLSIYLPTRGALQRATQYAATTIATVAGDTWLFFDSETMSLYWKTDRQQLQNVYVSLFAGLGDIQEVGEKIVTTIEGRSISSKAGTLTVECYVNNRLIYQEVVIKAVREFPIPIDLSFVGFPRSIPIAVTSKAVVHNGDAFVRNIDMAVDFADFISEQFGVNDLSETISMTGRKITSLLGWR